MSSAAHSDSLKVCAGDFRGWRWRMWTGYVSARRMKLAFELTARAASSYWHEDANAHDYARCKPAAAGMARLGKGVAGMATVGGWGSMGEPLIFRRRKSILPGALVCGLKGVFCVLGDPAAGGDRLQFSDGCSSCLPRKK